MNTFKKYFSLFCDVLEKIVMVVLAILLAYMTLITIVEVLRRYIFGQSFRWSEETVRFALIWTTFIGAAVGYRRGSLVAMDLVTSKLSGKKAGVILATFVKLLVLGTSVYLFSKAFTMTTGPSVTDYTAPGSGMPMVIPYAGIPIGLGLIIIFALEKLFYIGDDFRALKEGE